jgi:hypothetical protein
MTGYPPDFLLIGGTHDGEYYKGAPLEVIYLEKPHPKRVKRQRKSEPPPGVTIESGREIYRLRQFHADNQTLVVYAHDSLSDFDAQLSLIRGYRRP